MNNYLGSDDVVTLVAPGGGVVGGVPVVIGGLVAIPRANANAGDEFAGYLSGVFRLTKATGFVPAAGDVAYWDEADEALNSDTANVPIGHYTAEALTGDTTALVRLIDTPLALASSLDQRLDALEAGSVIKQLVADGTQVTMSVSDTYVNFTADALSLDADSVEDNDTVEWEAEVKLDAMNAAYATTFGLLIGALEVDQVVISTGDTSDWAKLKGTARCTAVGASSTWEVFGGEGCNSDGGSVTRDTPTYLGAQTGPATTSAVVFTARIKAATGSAGNHATLKHFKIKHHKAA